MKKTVTKTITKTKDEYYCDICGKKLDKESINALYPWSIVHYNIVNYNGKLDETEDEFNIPFDFCKECNLKAGKLILREWIEFAKKFENKDKVKEMIKNMEVEDYE